MTTSLKYNDVSIEIINHKGLYEISNDSKRKIIQDYFAGLTWQQCESLSEEELNTLISFNAAFGDFRQWYRMNVMVLKSFSVN